MSRHFWCTAWGVNLPASNALARTGVTLGGCECDYIVTKKMLISIVEHYVTHCTCIFSKPNAGSH